LRAGQYVAAREYRGDGLKLDGGGSVVTFIGNGTE
jgi:hypothetical protein